MVWYLAWRSSIFETDTSIDSQLFLEFSKSVHPSSRKTRATEPLEIIALKKAAIIFVVYAVDLI